MDKDFFRRHLILSFKHVFFLGVSFVTISMGSAYAFPNERNSRGYGFGLIIFGIITYWIAAYFSMKYKRKVESQVIESDLKRVEKMMKAYEEIKPK